MSLASFVLRRFGRGVLTIWFAVTVTFLLLRLLPGDPALAVASPNMTEETRAEKRNKFGGVKYVYQKDMMVSLRRFFEAEIARRFPQGRILYWT